MTTFASAVVTCAACSCEFKISTVISTNAFGSADLDTRPPPMRRNTMYSWVRRCPSCGYCASDVTRIDECLKPVLTSANYRAQLLDSRYPDLAASFLCSAILHEAAGRYDFAVWSTLHAAWVLDDQALDGVDADELAKLCRCKVVNRLAMLAGSGSVLIPQVGATEALTLDCLRRAARFADAMALADATLTREDLHEVVRSVIAFERTLVTRGDVACHTISEALAAKT